MSKQALKLGAAFVVAIGLAGGTAQFLSDYEYSGGDRTGKVTKLSSKGIGCKTWEGQLAMKNMVTGPNGTMSNSFAYSVKNPAVVEQLQKALENEQDVVLTYAETVFQWPCEQDTRYEITKVTPK